MVKHVQNVSIKIKNQIKIKQSVSVRILNMKIKINCVNFVIHIKSVFNVSTQWTVQNVILQKGGNKMHKMVNVNVGSNILNTTTLVIYVLYQDVLNARVKIIAVNVFLNPTLILTQLKGLASVKQTLIWITWQNHAFIAMTKCLIV